MLLAAWTLFVILVGYGLGYWAGTREFPLPLTVPKKKTGSGPLKPRSPQSLREDKNRDVLDQFKRIIS